MNIFDEVNEELETQREKWGRKHDDAHTANDWVAILSRHAGLSVDDGGVKTSDRFRKQMIRVAAIAISAIRAFDRNYGPPQKAAGLPPESRGSGV